jgi:hypothetical protein
MLDILGGDYQHNKITKQNKFMIKIPVSVGELIDKLSILHIKQVMILDNSKLDFVNKEFELLYNFSSEYLNNEEIFKCYHELIQVNMTLWKIEDELRIIESQKKFDDNFIELSRLVYKNNDNRFTIKNKINQLTNSEIQEQKDYVNYQ